LTSFAKCVKPWTLLTSMLFPYNLPKSCTKIFRFSFAYLLYVLQGLKDNISQQIAKESFDTVD
jgi:hypothetical protein